MLFELNVKTKPHHKCGVPEEGGGKGQVEIWVKVKELIVCLIFDLVSGQWNIRD